MEQALYVTNKININEWKKFMLVNPQGNIFQIPEIVEVYKRARNHEPIYLCAKNEKEEITSIIVGVIRSEKKGILKSLSSWSLIIGGPVFLDTPAGKVVMEDYDLIAKQKAIFNEIRMLTSPEIYDGIFKSLNYRFEDHYNAFIRLDKPKEQLWRQLKKDKRRGVNKAKKMGILIQEIEDREEIEIFYDLLSETYNRIRMPLPHISFYKAIYDILIPRNMAKIFFAKLNGEYVATRLILTYKETIYALVTGSRTEYLKYRPNDLMIWQILEWGNDNGYKLFDFMGGGTPTKNQNIRYFKSCFGAEFPNYGRYKKTYSPVKMKVGELGLKFYRKFKI